MHEARMLALSNLYDELENFAFSPTGAEMCLYGDPAYPLRVHLQAPFPIGIFTRDMQIFNDSMSTVHASVEWLFADINNYFKFLDFKKDLKIGLSQVCKMYIVCALLGNALTCLDSNSTAEYFGLVPPPPPPQRWISISVRFLLRTKGVSLTYGKGGIWENRGAVYSFIPSSVMVGSKMVRMFLKNRG